MTQPYSPPNFPPPTAQPGTVSVPRAARGSRVLAATAFVAVAAAVMGGVALGRHTASTSVTPVTSSTATASAPDPAAVAAAKSEACTAWTAASRAMVIARQPFADKTQGQSWAWTDPVVVDALTAAQAGMSAQIEYMRQHLPAATPPAVAEPVRDFLAANIDVIAADGQHQRAAVANKAAGRANAAADRIRTACGAS